MRLGALDYFTKPFSMDELRLKIRQHLETRRLKQENLLLKRALNTRHQFSSILGRSDAMQAVFATIEAVANTGSTVLISGESGTGKELVARAIHFNSLRRDRPFVAVNCGALPEALLESELFGHVRGAFTGAHANKKGLMAAAERGTIFLDEIGEMVTSMQVKLLRVLQDRRFRPVGGTDEVQADLRVIAATNQDLPNMVADGRFREDLYYRLNVLPIVVPPLRERVEDIPLLAEHFLAQFAEQMDKRVRTISAPACSCCGTISGEATFVNSRTLLSAQWRLHRRRRFFPKTSLTTSVSVVQPLAPRPSSCPRWPRGSTWTRKARPSIVITWRWRWIGRAACR